MTSIYYVWQNVNMSKIKEFREQIGYTQSDFAKQLGIDRSTLFHLEKGRHKPSLKTIMALRQIVNLHNGGRKVLLDKILGDFLSDNIIADDVK